jgi:hypothetical protein
MDQSIVDPIIKKISHHRKRGEYHFRRADEWEVILAQIQALQRQEQPSGKTDEFALAIPKPKKERPANRNLFARELLQQSAQDGILPVDIRRLANEVGFSCPTNYPYKLLSTLVDQGKAYKDEASGKYFPVPVTVELESKRKVRTTD